MRLAVLALIALCMIVLVTATPSPRLSAHRTRQPKPLAPGDKILTRNPAAVAKYGHPVVDWWSKHLKVYDDNEPQQVKLAFVPNGMTVSWYTAVQGADPPTVLYGSSPHALNESAYGNTHAYSPSDGWFHDVVLTGLQPNTLYYYLILAPAFNGTVPVYNFTTARAAGDTTPFSVLVVGDVGLVNSQPTIDSMHRLLSEVDFYYHLGDLSYADDYFLRKDTYEGAWNKWSNIMQNITSQKAYMALPGNHEATCNEVMPFFCDQHLRNFSAYLHRVRMPAVESGAVNNMWYSFDYGMVHFISISTETDIPNAPDSNFWLNAGPFGDQLGWLEQDLIKANQNRHITPWIIVSGHRPLYTASPLDVCTACIASFEPLFLKYNVDLVFQAHVHWYERIWPVANGTVTQKDYDNPPSPVYIVNGAAGNVEGHDKGVSNNFTAFLDKDDFGYGMLQFWSPYNLTWSFYVGGTDKLVDTITLIKAH